MSSDADKARAFHHWLCAMKSPGQIALFDQQDVEGLLMLADGARLTQQHVDESVAMMTEAGMGPDVILRVRRLAELLVEFEENPHVPSGLSIHPSSPPWLVPVAPPVPKIHLSAVSSPYAEKVEAFLVWLQSTGNPADLALYEQTDVERLLIRANGQPITSKHVDETVARENSSGVFRAYRLGQLLMRFEAGTPAQSGLWTQEQVKVMAARREGAVAQPQVAEPATAERSTPLSRRARIAIGAGVAATATVAALVLWWSGVFSDAPAPAPAPAAQAPVAAIERLDGLDLAVQFPPGWHRSNTGPASPVEAVLFRGDSEQTARQRAFIGLVPQLSASVAAAAPSPEALLRWARAAEHAAAERVKSDATTYVSAGCEVVDFGGQRVGRCLGAAGGKGSSTTWLQTWLRLGPRRAAVAVFLDAEKAPSAATTSEIERVVASLSP